MPCESELQSNAAYVSRATTEECNMRVKSNHKAMRHAWHSFQYRLQSNATYNLRAIAEQRYGYFKSLIVSQKSLWTPLRSFDIGSPVANR